MFIKVKDKRDKINKVWKIVEEFQIVLGYNKIKVKDDIWDKDVLRIR